MKTMSTQGTERELYREISRAVEAALPGVEVLALELNGKERFCVYVDHPQGVDHGLCERVAQVLQPYLDRYSVEVSSPGSERPLRRRRDGGAAGECDPGCTVAAPVTGRGFGPASPRSQSRPVSVSWTVIAVGSLSWVIFKLGDFAAASGG